MKNKLLSIMLAALFCWGVTGITMGQSSITEGGITISSDEVDVDNADNVELSTGYVYTTFTITANGEYTVSGQANNVRLEIEENATVHLILQNVSIVSNRALRINGAGATVELTLVGTNELSSTGTYAGIVVPTGASLTINGSGVLNVEGGNYYAGIGGGDNCGQVNINGGTVNVTGGPRSRAIGGGRNASGSVGAVTITGGTLTATGGADFTSDPIGGTIVITGGSIEGTMSSQPTNGADPVYLNTLTIGEEPVANTFVSGCNQNYGLSEVSTDAEGKVYFYLPATAGEEEIRITAGGKTYSARYQRNEDNDNAATLLETTPNSDEERIAELTQQLADLQAALEDSIEIIHNLKSALADSVAVIQELRDHPDCSQLQTKIDELQTEINTLNQQITDLSDEIDALVTEKTTLTNQVDDLETDTADYRQNIRELTDNLADSAVKIDNLKSDVSDLERDKAELETANSALEAANSDLDDLNKVLEGKLADSAAMIVTLKAEIEDLKVDLNNCSNLGPLVDDLRNKIAQLQDQLADSALVINTLKESIVELNIRIEALNSDLRDSAHVIALLRLDKSQLAAENENLKGRIAELEEALAGCGGGGGTCVEAEQRIAILRDSVADLSEQLLQCPKQGSGSALLNFDTYAALLNGKLLVLNRRSIEALNHGEAATCRWYSFDIHDGTSAPIVESFSADVSAFDADAFYFEVVTADGTTYYSNYKLTDVATSSLSRQALSLAVYPNPTSGELHITGGSMQAGEIIKFYDVRGTLVLTKTSAGTTMTVDVSSLLPGTYVVKVGNDVAKMVKQ